MPDSTPAEGTFAAALAAAKSELGVDDVRDVADTAPDEDTSHDEPTGDETPVVEEPAETGDQFTIKVNGAEKQVTRDELVRLAQMGDDYTQKTQALAAEKQQHQVAIDLLNRLRENPTGTFDELRQIFGVADDEYDDLDPEEQRLIDVDRRISGLEEDVQQRAISAKLDDLHTRHGEFDDVALVNHAIRIGTADLDVAYRDMTYDSAVEAARAAREQETKTADEAAVEAKRKAQLVEGGNTGVTNVEPVQTTEKKSFGDMLKEALRK